jgi:hypothetical protein
LAIVGVIVILGLIAPKDYCVKRSVSINAPSDIVKDQVIKFENFKEWEPWGDADPNMKVSIDGEDGTVGAIYSWEGNNDVGSGRQEIIKMTDSRVDVKLNFTAPWESEDFTYYEFNTTGDNTEVTWGMNGTNPFPMNVMMMFMDLEGMIGSQYEVGLERVKTRCEKIAAEERAQEEAEMQTATEAKAQEG